MNKEILKEAHGYPGYYAIPGYSWYVIKPDGTLRNRVKNHFLSGSKNPDGYINFRITDDNGKTRTWGRHRLLAFVFLTPGPDIADLVVNHKNAIKGDDRLDNLEWVTYQGNSEHAGSLGITEKCQPISVRDVDTGVVVNYPSIVACAREYGVSKDYINWRVKKGEEYCFPERKQYRGSHNKDAWLKVKNNSEIKASVKYLTTGEIRNFKKLTDLAIHLKIAPSTLSEWMSKENQPVLPGYIQLKRGNDVSPWREVYDYFSDHDNNRLKRTIKVINARTGEVAIYPSAVECAKRLGLLPTTLHERLRSGGKKVFSDGKRYSYYSSSIQ